MLTQDEIDDWYFGNETVTFAPKPVKDSQDLVDGAEEAIRRKIFPVKPSGEPVEELIKEAIELDDWEIIDGPAW